MQANEAFLAVRSIATISTAFAFLVVAGCSGALEQSELNKNQNTKLAPQAMSPVDADELKAFLNPARSIDLTEHGSFAFGDCEPEIIDTRNFQHQIQIAQPVAGQPPKSSSSFRPPKGPRRIVPKGPTNNLVTGRVSREVRVSHETFFPAISESPWNPPDPALAVGPNHIVQTVNMELAFFAKDGTQTFQQTLDASGDPGFFESVGSGNNCFDPKCFYDHYSNRFFVLALEVYTNTAFITFAVSDDDDPNGVWFRYRTDAEIQVGDATYWVDYPGMGFDEDGFYVTGNLNRLSGSGDATAGALFRSFDKAPLLTGSPVSFTDIRDGSITSVQVAQCFGDNIAPMFIGRESSSELKLIAIENAFTNPTFDSSIVSVPDGQEPPFAPNGNGFLLNTVGSRVMNVNWRDGKLYTCNTVDIGSRAVVRWYEFDTNNWPTSGDPTFVQSGDIDLGEGNHTFFPAIYSNNTQSLGIVFGKSRNGEFASVQAAGRLACDPTGTMSAPTILETGSATASGRWGDYFDIALDPSDESTFWMAGEIETTSGWQTVINSFTIAAPFEAVDQLDFFRGVQVAGTSADLTDSDDQYLRVTSGAVANPTEAPVWLIFEGNASSDCYQFAIESSANTPGLTYTTELFNFSTGQYENAGTSGESFNADVLTLFPLESGNVDSGGEVRARVGWRRTGFTILFPWTVRIDVAGWQL